MQVMNLPLGAQENYPDEYRNSNTRSGYPSSYERSIRACMRHGGWISGGENQLQEGHITIMMKENIGATILVLQKYLCVMKTSRF